MSLGAGQREYIAVNITSVATGESIFIPMPEKCVVTKLWVSVEAQLDDILTTTLEIGGTAITGASVAIAAGGAAGLTGSSACTALNEVAAGGTVEVIFNGTPTTTCSGTALIEISKGT